MRSIGRSVRSVCEIKIFVRFVPYVGAPLRTKIREIREIRVRPLSSSSMCKKLFVLFELFVFKENLVFKMMSVQDDEWFICGKWIHVIGVTHDRCDTWF